MKIACVGDNCVDYYDNTGEAFPGGNPVNVAVYVRRMGGQSAYLGAVGTDAYGGLILQALEEKGGWQNEDTARAFAVYTAKMAEHL